MKKVMKLINLLLMVAAVCILFNVTPETAQAAVMVRQLDTGTYTCDITRDGNADTLKVVSGRDSSSGLYNTRIYVNGSQKLNLSASRGVTVFFYRVDTTNTFLLVNSHYAGGGNETSAYVYSSGKFQSAWYNTISSRYANLWYASAFARVSGNKVYVTSQEKYPSGSLSKLADYGTFVGPKIVSTFQATGGKLKLVSTSTDMIGLTTLYAVNAFKTGNSISTAGSGNGPSVVKGQKVILEKAYYNTSTYTFYFRVKVDGKSGWIKNSSSTLLTHVAPKKGTQAISASHKVTTLGNGSFSIGAKRTAGNGALTYSSSNKSVATISSTGKVTIKGVGRTTITIKAAETASYWSCTKQVIVQVNPKGTSISRLDNPSSGKMRITLNQNSAVSGYQLQILPKGGKSVYIVMGGYKNLTKVFSSLPKNQTYYVRVRTYKTVSGTHYLSAWSSVKSVTIKK